MPLLEVIACSLTDAIAAQTGGAGRLEIVRCPEVGGLTPPAALVREIVAEVSIPVRVMLRENSGFEVAGEVEVETLCRAAREFSQLGVDGVVFGFLRGRDLDLPVTERVLSAAPTLKATFHRAFEELPDREAAVAALKRLHRFDRILVSPGRVRNLNRLIESAAPELTLIAGGGLDRAALQPLLETTTIREFHFGRAARHGNDIHQPVDSVRVRELAARLGA
ncbi:MAG: copper homeostasis protein CutC [Bryobacterales bacterium]|nr:copper homeostasis protein CutC [Bryobacterales bacterium]